MDSNARAKHTIENCTFGTEATNILGDLSECDAVSRIKHIIRHIFG